jgi:hypothetical protein
MTRLEMDIADSRKLEMEIYLSSLKDMYSNSVIQNGEVYDIASTLTKDFSAITKESILADSRIIKVFRYAMAPSISQMKFGQFFGLNSIDKFENDKLTGQSRKFKMLEEIADEIANFTLTNIDRSRFLWLNQTLSPSEFSLAKEYAKRWTCSIAADQNAQTRYRNWRKDQQEHSVASELIKLGYVKSNYAGVVTRDTDINIGEYTQELRIKGRTTQKADSVVRSKKTKKLVLIEAKAVGVEIDSTKRIKECCDKANDWKSSDDLSAPQVISVIGGFFTTTGIENLEASQIGVVWEHRLADLGNYL